MGGFEGATKTHQQMMQKDIGKGEEEHSPDNQTEFEKSKGGNKNSSLNLNMKNLTSLSLQQFEDGNILFKDFTEPDLLKTGYLIPVSCGHNGQLSY